MKAVVVMIFGTDLDVMNSMMGAPAQTQASCLQSRNAPRAKDERRPMCERTFEAEQRLARIEG